MRLSIEKWPENDEHEKKQKPKSYFPLATIVVAFVIIAERFTVKIESSASVISTSSARSS